ncbi:MAG: hypothetical protein OXC48_10900 [Endozoicomonadaceae bacterium]|nr:hypothetical protein [Endozoicomonadaceae bacterium]
MTHAYHSRPAESGSLSLCTSDFLWLPSDPAVSPQRLCQSDFLPLSPVS